MKIYKIKGVVIKRKNWGEADRLITSFTDSLGKIIFKAKGVRKPLSKHGGHLEIFSLSNIELVEGKGLPILTSAQIINPFFNIQNDLKKIILASHICEIIDKTTAERIPSKKIFNLLTGFFNYLDRCKKIQSKLLLSYFIINLMSFLGHKPELYKCTICHKKIVPSRMLFSAKNGGLVCCRKDGLTISSATVKCLRLFLNKNFTEIVKYNIAPNVEDEIFKIINYFMDFVFGNELKSRKFLQQFYNLKILF